MTQRRFITAIACCAVLLLARSAGAQPEGQPCEAEPTDQLIAYGDHINPCDIGELGDSDLFRFNGAVGETVWIRVIDQSGSFVWPSCSLELLGPGGGLVTSVVHGNTCEVSTSLAVSGLFTVRVSEAGNDHLMTYTVQLDRLMPISEQASSINPGETITGAVIDPLGDADLFVFNGVSGNLVSLRATDQSGTFVWPSCVMELYRPDGTLVTAVVHSNICVIETTLDQDGVYTIRILEAGNDHLMTYNLEHQCIIGNCPTFHTLTASRTGAGTVTSSPIGIDCGADCWERYFDGTVVGLTATPDPGWTFGGWTGDSDCADGAVTMNGGRHCIATFTSGSPVPTSVDDAYSAGANTVLTVPAPGVLGNDDSHGGGAMTAALVTNVSHGSLALGTDGGFTYTPTSGFTGVDSFVYRAQNANGLGNTATVTLTVTTLPPPTAADDAYAVTANTTLNIPAPGVLGNDSANGGGALTAVLVATTAHGTLALNVNGGFTYVPGGDFVGADAFTYRAATTAGTSNVATVTINVTSPTSVQPPRNLAVVGNSGLVVKLRWDPPLLGPAPTGYVLKGGTQPGQVLAAIPTGSTATFFTFVAPSGSFYVRMHSLLGAEESGPSNEVALHVSVPVAPSAPATLLGMGNGSFMALAWRNTFEGGPPSNLVLDVTGAFNGTFSLGLAETFQFPAVPPGTYTMSVRAANAGGSSGPSNPVTLTFPSACSGAPSAPANFLAYKEGSTLFVVWDPPESGPAPTSYLVNVSGAFVGSIPTAVRTLSGTVGPGSYGLSVAAVNPCGASAATPEQVVVIP